MYEDCDFFDPNAMMMVPHSTKSAATEEEYYCFTQMGPESDNKKSSFSENVGLSMETTTALPCPPFSSCDHQQQQEGSRTSITSAGTLVQMGGGFDMENTYISFNDGSSSNNSGCSNQDLSFVDHHHHQQQQQFPATPDLLNLLQFPTRSPNNNTIGLLEPSSEQNGNWVVGGGGGGGVKVSPFPSYLNLQAPPFALRGMFHPSRADFVFGLGDGEENNGYHHQDIDGDFELTAQDLGCNGNKKKRGGRRGKQFPSTTTERQRRVDLSSKFDALKELIPNPTKNDRASVVEDANNYIRELVRTVNELKLLAEKKRYEKQRVRRHKKVVEAKAESEQQEEAKGSPPPLLQDPDDDHSYSESLRSSWIQRKSKDTEVDVRIIDNEVTVKLVQRKRNSLLLVHASHVLDELNLNLQHVAGGHIGDFCSFMFNSKICEGSSVYASAIANKLIEAMDKSSAAV